ncbi:MAG: hypothetical protein FJ197_00750 [Gammaproteobacteria bacterium]|nr:hypothetical protein [Gammaproteobacteria bacterium]
MSDEAPGARAALAFTCVLVVWGTTYLAVAWMLADLPVFTSLGARFFFAAAVMYALARRQSPRPLEGIVTSRAMLSGVLMGGCGTGFTGVAMLGMASGVAALLNATIPICVTLLAWAFFERRRPVIVTAVGLLTGFCGVVLVVGGEAWSGPGDAAYVAAMAFAVVAWSIGTLIQRDLVSRDRLQSLCCVQFAAAGVFLCLLGLFAGEWREIDLAGVTPRGWFALAYLTLVGSVLTQSAYLWLLARYPAEKVTSYAIINPAIAMLLGAAFLGERITSAGLAGAALVLGGVSLVLFERSLMALVRRN